MKKLTELLEKEVIALNPAAKQKLVRAMPIDKILLKNKAPSKAYLIIKLALVELSEKIGAGKQVFGEKPEGKDEGEFLKSIQKRVKSKINENQNLTESFGISDNSPREIAMKTHDGILRELVECTFPFSEQIKAIKSPLRRKSTKVAYEYLRETLIIEVRRLGVFNVR